MTEPHGASRLGRSLTRLFIVFALCVASAPLPALTVDAKGGGAWRFGAMSYTIAGPLDASTGYMSRLDFPVDGFAPSFSVTVGEQTGTWRLDLEGSVNLVSPYGSMIDQDWYVDRTNSAIPPMLFSYTRSGVDSIDIDASARLTYVVADLGASQLGIRAGYGFSNLAQTVNGYDGYQYIYNTSAGAFDLYTVSAAESVAVLTYQATTHEILAGAVVEQKLYDFLAVRLGADASYVFANDVDDHVLRTKRSTSSNQGFGYAVDLSIDLTPFTGRADASPPLSLELFGSIGGFHTSGNQTQVWYGSSDSGVPAGTEASGIGHTLSSFRSTVGLRMGYAF